MVAGVVSIGYDSHYAAIDCMAFCCEKKLLYLIQRKENIGDTDMHYGVITAQYEFLCYGVIQHHLEKFLRKFFGHNK